MTFKSVGKNLLAVFAGLAIGSLVNMGIVNIGPAIIPLPEGADVSTMETLRESMKMFKPVNFIVPFVAHALGTLVAAFIAAKFVTSQPMKFAIGIGVFFLIGGIAAVSMFGGPWWFLLTDLGLAYIPMGYLGGILSGRTRSAPADPVS